jgi:hypothetical protein
MMVFPSVVAHTDSTPGSKEPTMQLDPHTALRTAEQHGRERRELAADGRLHRLLRAPMARSEAPPPSTRPDVHPTRRARSRRIAVNA